MSQSAIEVKNLTRVFLPSGKKDAAPVRAVDDISFSIPRGSTTGLLGGNGAGKTTTISMLLGTLVPTSGAISVVGHDILKNRYAALARMNFCSPYLDLPKKLTVYQNLMVYGQLYNVRNVKSRIAELAADLDLDALLGRLFGKLSAGQQTRVSLAKALINHPDVLLMDEPTASLDPDSADRMRGYLEQYCAKYGMTILLASHNMREVERLCDNVLMMKQGRIVDQGAPQELISRYGRRDMEEVFLHVARGHDVENGECVA